MLQAAEHRADTARREVRQQALAERAALLESITDAFYALDHRFRFTYVNQRALEHFKKEREELLGQRIGDVFPVLEGTLIETHLLRVQREQSSAAFEALSPVGGSWIELNVYPAGQGLAIYFRDISDRKRAEQELQRTQEVLRESDRRKSEFLALLAHELRNPLAPIGNGLKILQLRSRPDLVSERALEMMERQLKHLVRLVDDLLDVGRITSGKLQLRTQPVFIADVLATAVDITRGLMESRGHELLIDIRDEDLTVEADPDRLVQVVSNLLANSAKYTERAGSIRLVAERQGGAAVIAVMDNGIGIPSDSIANVFEMLSQLRSDSSRSEGTTPATCPITELSPRPVSLKSSPSASS
jgi:PAS domain S-box-containing protein